MTVLALLAAKPPVAHAGHRPSSDPARLVALHPSSNATTTNRSTLFPALDHTPPTLPPVGPANAPPNKSTIVTDAPRALNPHRARCTVARSTSRDFVPWRFSDACRQRAWMGSSSRRPRTCTITALSM